MISSEKTALVGLVMLVASASSVRADSKPSTTVSTQEVAVRRGVPVGEAALGCRAPYPLRNKNSDLTSELRHRLERAGFGEALAKGDLAVSVVDLTDGEPVYAGIRDTEMMYAASLPKITILLAVVEAVREGRVPWTAELAKRLSSMINVSSNRDATWSANLVGTKYIEKVLRRPGRCLYGDRTGGLWLGRAYSRSAPARRDPVGNVNHGATTRQIARFYTLLSKGMLVEGNDNRRILSLMSSPMVGRKFVGGLRFRKNVRFLARKSGSWWHYHSDSALIEHHGVRYAVAALSKNVKNKKHRLAQVAQVVDTMMLMRHRRSGLLAGQVTGDL